MNEPLNTNGTAGFRKALVEKLISMGCIRSPSVERAFRTVPRHLFLPGIVLKKYIATKQF
jgi:protein-L-isoaspartate(D-aspartate) O-methyltransferase